MEEEAAGPWGLEGCTVLLELECGAEPGPCSAELRAERYLAPYCLFKSHFHIVAMTNLFLQ